MQDHFATLSQPRQPWLDPEEVKQTFLNLSSEVHPDRVHNSTIAEREAANREYTQLNDAYRCLSNTRERLRHLLELETGGRPAEVQAVPDGMLELFMQITPCLREADSLAAKRTAAESSLLKVRLLQESQTTIDQLQALQHHLEQAQLQFEDELKRNTEHPELNLKTDWKRLEEIYRRLSYLNRWSSQIRERILNLSP